MSKFKVVLSEKKYTRDESNISLCPAWVIFTMPFFVIGAAVCIALVISQFRSVTCYISGGILVLIGIWSVFVDVHYSFYENCRIKFRNGIVTYEYDLNRSVIASSNVTVSIVVSEISRLRVKRKKVIVYGEIEKTAPFKKPVKLKKVELPIDFVERDEIIEELKKLKKGGRHE